MAVPSGKVYRCEAYVKQAELTIPYQGTVHFENTDMKKYVYGVYKGVRSVNMYQTILDVTPK